MHSRLLQLRTTLLLASGMAGHGILIVRLAGSSLSPLERLLAIQMGIVTTLLIAWGLDAFFHETP